MGSSTRKYEKTKKETFSVSGPSYLTSVNWQNAHHRRSVAASLVQGVYILERDRQKKRQDQNALAPPWWSFFHFQLKKLLTDKDSHIAGAIYEYKHRNISIHGAPRFVIAFRGNMLKGDSAILDLILDLNLIGNHFHHRSRYTKALEEVQAFVKENGGMNIWIAGHSLGSTMDMLVGKTMAISGIMLETFLFNPPFVSTSYERIKSKVARDVIGVAKSFSKAALSVALKSHEQRQRSENRFATLSSWLPTLFVHPSDGICSSYIVYFEVRKHMVKSGFGFVETCAMTSSRANLLLNTFGKEESDDPVHLLPSACLMTNLSPALSFSEAHGLHQWWKIDLNLQSNLYENMSSPKAITA